LLGLTRVVSNVNLPNTALQIPNLPLDAVVETNAVFSRNSVHPIAAGPVPQPIRALILPHVENHARILKAAEDIASGTPAAECKELVIEAFLNDPLVKGHTSSREDVAALVDDMIQATSAYLPKEWLQ
jgi:alpha-galactosidase